MSTSSSLAATTTRSTSPASSWPSSEALQQIATTSTSASSSKDSVSLTTQAYLLTLRCLALCSWSYLANDLQDNLQQDLLEEKQRQLLGIQDLYTLWQEKGRFRQIQDEHETSLVITGVLHRPVHDGSVEKVPFVCFRGTQSIQDVQRDVRSLYVKPFITMLTGKLIGGVGQGFLDFYDHFRQKKNPDLLLLAKPITLPVEFRQRHEQRVFSQGLLEHVASLVEEHQTGLMVTGHSLGGALSAVFMAEFAYEYKDLMIKYQANFSAKNNNSKEKKRLGFYCITFGSPRVFDAKATQFVENWRHRSMPSKLLYEHLRFVNDGDVVTSLPRNWWNILYHVGHPLYAKEKSATWRYVSNQPNFGIDSLQGYFWQTADFIQSAAKDHSLTSKLGYISQFKNSAEYQQALASIQDQQIKTFYSQLPLHIDS